MLRLVTRGHFCFTSTKFNEYIQLLELGKKSSQRDVKAKFIELAKRYHPDTGETKDATRFKNVLEAYRYLSVETNWPTPGLNNNTQQGQNARKSETREERERKSTYEYFNEAFRRKRNHSRVADSGPMGYDSFYQTIKAAPELKIFTIGFAGIAIIIWVFMMTGMKKRGGPHKVEYERIFYSKEDEREFREKKKKQKEKEFFKGLDFQQRFRRGAERDGAASSSEL